MNGQTVKCRICGDPYKVYSHYAGDQSACPDCVAKANEKMDKGYTANTLRWENDHE